MGSHPPDPQTALKADALSDNAASMAFRPQSVVAGFAVSPLQNPFGVNSLNQSVALCILSLPTPKVHHSVALGYHSPSLAYG